MKSNDKLMTVREVAERLALSERSVWRMSEDGRLPPPVRIGRAVRWREADIDEFIESLA